MIYGVTDPVFKTERLVVMLNDTWLDYGTQGQKMKRALDEALAAGAKLQVAYDIAVKSLAELQQKHNNLRAAEKQRRMSVFKLKRPKRTRK